MCKPRTFFLVAIAAGIAGFATRDLVPLEVALIALVFGVLSRTQRVSSDQPN